jgi:hypothetical protein
MVKTASTARHIALILRRSRLRHPGTTIILDVRTGKLNSDLQTGRPLTQQERALIIALVPDQELTARIAATLDNALVVDMNDGGMGSIRFVKEGNRRRACSIATAEYIDEDGVPVTVEVNASADNELFEVDFWKVDFSPLRRYPRLEDLVR